MDFSSFISLNTVTVAIAVVLLVLLVSRSLQWPAANLPPGPTRYPIIGSILLFRKGNVLEVFRRLRAQYGDVYTVKIGVNLAVVICGEVALNEAFIKHAHDFSDRFESLSNGLLLKNKGIIFSSGEYWTQTRAFAFTALRNFGFGRKSMESRIREEIAVYMNVIEQQKGKPYDMKELTIIASSNIICSVTFGNRFEYNDSNFRRITSLFAEEFRLLATGSPAQAFPFLKYLPGDLFNIKKLIQNTDKIKSFVLERIIEHQNTFDEDNHRDFIDAFLSQQKQHGQEGTIFEDSNLMASVMNLFAAGTDTTATMIRWAIIYLIHNKPIQVKLRQEIMTVIGTSRLPSLNDQSDMPYYEAFITEVFRMGNIGPLAGPHGTPKDINFQGMVIPKGSLIIPNLDSIMTDPDIFQDPGTFDPQRFLGEDGQLNGKEKRVMPFGLGRRICFGESLVRMELFLFLTSLVQKFEFLPESPDKLPSTDGILGIIRGPLDFKCRAVKLD